MRQIKPDLRVSSEFPTVSQMHTYFQTYPSKILVVVLIGALLIIIGKTLSFHRYRKLQWSHYSSPYLVKPSTGPNLKLLPNLTSLTWPTLNRPNGTSKHNEGFDVAYTIGNYRTAQTLLLKFQSVMISLNLQDQWFLTAGTLIGSHRHHDLIPWDDDADVFIDLTYRNITEKALRALEPEFGFNRGEKYDKFYFAFQPDKNASDPNTIGSFKLIHYPWNWPFIDIFYYKKLNGTHLYDESWGYYSFKQTDVFPTLYRPLGHNWFPTPRKPLSFLLAYYASDQHICVSGNWRHATETGKHSVSVPCSQLTGQYAFVQRCPVPTEEREQLGGAEACDEYLLHANGSIIHKIRTFLDCTTGQNPVFMVKNDAFKCP